MNTTTTQAGIILSLMLTVTALLVVLIVTRGKGAMVSVPVTMFFSILLFTFMQWFPTWTGSVIALILVIFMGYVFARLPGGSL